MALEKYFARVVELLDSPRSLRRVINTLTNAAKYLFVYLFMGHKLTPLNATHDFGDIFDA
ncbi:MAG: hypothetical protein HQL07_02820 [Nitrospirae bacterium]|nr:hypothetical protein [Magnetococcales bacterium]